MIGFSYLAVLLVSITGMVVLDRRFRLFFWVAPARAAMVLLLGVSVFLLWDGFGILLGVFFRGQTEFMTGVLLAPELPLEELFFLVLLSYLTMNVYGGLRHVLGEDVTDDGAVPARAADVAGGAR
ncbi:C50 carotenoid epsilon cyclase [Actinotalea ferrariae CF5-4]|uniref:C50 carotenoid epsilon cyclase n=1 Tax=Actinotalea ferrariae CF5-4 TaxID=948458 RepID=A0A021VQB5_9CELL|nr:lycopene cyclase domain-containing protein [Actinotalea ferrariae]EYR63308.1 C50 carotenoid epsilon cyclase [Actinotalea ferrariae CF5-4]